ncbi:fungal-specific transcription factor domain-containing protein [Tricladium varicosporioides]|nr:fungal-specific transcription factor domain-containing protein [Hymenoscyphus varicosporioides]
MASGSHSKESVRGVGLGPRKQRTTRIERVRTGCLTCRKRRKKCDELKPFCKNCHKANKVCRGYEKPVDCNATTASRKAQNHTGGIFNETTPQIWSVPHEGLSNFFPYSQRYPDYHVGHTSPIIDYQSLNSVQQQFLGYGWDSGLDFQRSTVSETASLTIDMEFEENGVPDGYSEPASYVDGTLYTNVDFAENKSNCCQGLVHGPVIRDGHNNETLDRKTSLTQVYVPAGLPFPILGVETELHQRLFCHFTQVLSHLLTTSVGNSNPMITVVVPLAMTERTVMDALLSLAGSHLSKLLPSDNSNLASEMHRLHQASLQTQPIRVEALKKAPITNRDGLPGQDAMFATSTLLWLFEICEGTGDDAWRQHLDTASDILMAGKGFQDSEQENTIVTEINPFLLQFFNYHDTIATLTSPTSPGRPRFKTNSASPDHDPFMIGVQDGLQDFMDRISSLRDQANASMKHPNGNVVSTAVAIWQDLKEWKPAVAFSPECNLTTQFYQRALWIWLFSIVYPEQQSAGAVQDIVKQTLIDMSKIKHGEGVMACLLFPLFVIGTAAIRHDDRMAILVQFQKLRDWSSLGNIDLSQQLVREMWEDHDKGFPRSWDWVNKLKTHGRSLLVA